MDVLAARGFQDLEPVHQSPNSLVFRGSHPGCATCASDVAIKLQTFSSFESIAKAYIEVKPMSGLRSHPNIVRFCESFDYRETENTWVFGIVTEWAGKDLMQDLGHRRTNSYPWSEADFVQIAHSLISGLAYLERQGIYLGDIKPQNIFYSPVTKVAKIGGFGCAKSIYSRESVHAIVGTQASMSEEFKKVIASWQQHAYHDAIKPDVYSLGLILLTIATLEATVFVSKGQVSPEWIRQQITALNYSDYPKRLIWEMLEIDPLQRPTFVQLEERYCPNILPTIEMQPGSTDPQLVVDDAQFVEPSGDHIEVPFPDPQQEESDRLIAEHQKYLCCPKKTSDTPHCDISCRNHGIIRFCGKPCLIKYVEIETKGYAKEEAKCPVCVGLLDYGAVIEAYGGRESYLNYRNQYNDPAVRCVSCRVVRATLFLECGHIYCKACLQAYEQGWLYTASYICSGCSTVTSKRPEKLTEVSWLSRFMLCGTRRRLEGS